MHHIPATLSRGRTYPETPGIKSRPGTYFETGRSISIVADKKKRSEALQRLFACHTYLKAQPKIASHQRFQRIAPAKAALRSVMEGEDIGV